jgi:two-component system, LytTR family, response regulator
VAGGVVSAPLKVVLADDERPARSVLAALLRQHEEVEIVGEAADGASAVRLVEEIKPDLVFLDLQMPELDGLEVVRLLKPEAMPLIVFVTAYDQYAVQAFEAHAVDYLLKPVEPMRLARALQRAQDRLERDDARASARASAQVTKAVASIEAAGSREYLRRLPVRHNDDVVLVPVERIAALEAQDETVRVTTAANERFTVHVRLKDLESRLDPKRFVRLSRSVICNGDLIVRVTPLDGGLLQFTLASGLRLTASRMRSRELRGRLLEL